MQRTKGDCCLRLISDHRDVDRASHVDKLLSLVRVENVLTNDDVLVAMRIHPRVKLTTIAWAHRKQTSVSSLRVAVTVYRDDLNLLRLTLPATANDLLHSSTSYITGKQVSSARRGVSNLRAENLAEYQKG